ncbi:MAG: hypothetical protein QMD92_00130 [bacterium]|nr:hypothetical protein [bacterium]
MATVYCINNGGHDYSDALRFGKIKFLSEGPVSKFAISKMYRDFAMKLRESAPTDYILLSGLTTMACVACSCFAFLHGRLNILIFKDNRYVERKLMLGELLKVTGPEDELPKV